MKIKMQSNRFLLENRFLWASIAMFVITGGLVFRLWYVQIFRGDYYKHIAERNRVRRVEISVPRGVVYDRHGEVILGNRPFFDLVYIPQYVREKDSTLRILSRLLNIPLSRFKKRLRASRGRPKFLPVTLKRNLTIHEVSIIQNNKIFLPGIEVRTEARREYKPDVPSHLVGYLREVGPQTLKKNNTDYKDNPYLPGDLVGKQGLEARWEKHLRGNRGYRLIQVDAFGRKTKLFKDDGWDYQVVPAVPGSDLQLTIDYALQKAVRKAFSGKFGAVIVMNPKNGEILATLSEPGFNPELMQTGLSREEWRHLTNNPYKPFLDKTTGGEFSPGSIFKPVVAMAGLEEGIMTPKTTVNCTGSFTLGNHTFFCHNRHGHGHVNLHDAMIKSCDIYFYQMGVELGVDKIAKYAKSFGLGNKLGIKLNLERPGLIPTSSWKEAAFRTSWTPGDTPNVSIGQGYVLMTPLQMASLYVALANGGMIWQPHIVKTISNHVGQKTFEQEHNLIHQVKTISPETFKLMRKILKAVVMDQDGTGKRARVPGQTVAGKTGSVQVVSLKRNRNQTDVSMRWKEHAIFAAFSPVEDAEIVVAVVSQNDKIGGGGKSAAPVAQKIIAKYWELKKQREGRLKVSITPEGKTRGF